MRRAFTNKLLIFHAVFAVAVSHRFPALRPPGHQAMVAKRRRRHCILRVRTRHAYLTGTKRMVRVTDLRWTQESCSWVFSDGRPIGSLFFDILEGRILPEDVEPLHCVRCRGRRGMVFSLDNRRLVVFHLLQQLGVIERVPCLVVTANCFAFRRIL